MKKSRTTVANETIINEFEKLSFKQKEQMIADLKTIIIKEYLNSDSKDHDDVICPHCGSKQYRKKGIVRQTQRFKRSSQLTF